MEIKFSHIEKEFSKMTNTYKNKYVFEFIKNEDESIYFYTTEGGEVIRTKFYNDTKDLILLCLEVLTNKDFINQEIKKAELKQREIRRKELKEVKK